jgi:hypothetical protein
MHVFVHLRSHTPFVLFPSIGNMPKRKQQAEEDSPSVDEEQQYKTDSSSSTSDSDAPLPDSEESSDDEAGEAFQQVDVDFGFYCPQEKDFLGMRTLMQNYLDGQEWACSDMVEAIIAQVRSFKLLTSRSRRMQHISAACKMHASVCGGRRWQRRLWLTNKQTILAPLQGDSAGVGSVIKCGEEDDPIGVSTVLNLARHADATPLRQLRDFLLAAAGSTHRRRLEQVRNADNKHCFVSLRVASDNRKSIHFTQQPQRTPAPARTLARCRLSGAIDPRPRCCCCRRGQPRPPA